MTHIRLNQNCQPFKIDEVGNEYINHLLKKINMTAAEIENNFTYHPPSQLQKEKYEALRNEAKELAHHINLWCPTSAEATLAIRKLEEAIMWANAAIARHTPTE